MRARDRSARRPTRAAAAAGILTAVLAVAGCGGAPSGGRAGSSTASEVNPAGDIPDNQAYVAYAVPHAGFAVKVPEGWTRTIAGGAVTFTDKLNAIRLETRRAPHAPTVRT